MNDSLAVGVTDGVGNLAQHVQPLISRQLLAVGRQVVIEPDGAGTRVTQEFRTVGWFSAISSWVFSRGSYEGSFRGELEKFGRIAEREAAEPS